MMDLAYKLNRGLTVTLSLPVLSGFDVSKRIQARTDVVPIDLQCHRIEAILSC